MDDNRNLKVARIMAAVVESIMDSDSSRMGIPGGHIYAVLMTTGISLSGFTTLMDGLVNAGALTRAGECYKVTPLGVEYVHAMRRVEGRMAIV